MNKIIVATDSYKGSLSAAEACRIIAEEATARFPRAEILQMPIADGGEGLIEALLSVLPGKIVEIETLDPLGRPIRANYALLEDGSALIEMASAAGLLLLTENERDPDLTSTYGVGLMILDAHQRGANPIYIGLGGSATIDGGVGAASALGLCFQNGVGEVARVARSGADLADLDSVEHSGFDRLAMAEELIFLVDVNSPLCGPNGAAVIYGPQKGADQEQIWRLNKGLAKLAALVEKDTNRYLNEMEGIGAAGGFALPFVAYANATMFSGINFVLDKLGFNQELVGTNLVITGEGRTDVQSALGKAISEVARRADMQGVRVAVISGLLGKGAENLFALGVNDLVQAAPPDVELKDALANAEEYLRTAVRNFLTKVENEES